MQVKALFSGVALWAMLVVSALAAESTSVDQWLQRLQSTQNVQNYQGAFVYERKGAFSTHLVQRQVDTQGQLLEHFMQLNGPAHEMMRINGLVTCMSAAIADEFATVDIWPAEMSKLQHLQRWYDVHVVGETRVAGHMTTVLLFSPQDRHRYPVELYLDEETAIPLKTLLLNDQGQLLERLQFVQFEKLSSQTESERDQPLISPSSNCLPFTQTQEEDEVGQVSVDWKVDWTPPGFVLLKNQYKQSVDNDSYVLSQVYSDGLAHFSVFFEDITDLDVEGGRRQLGPTAVVSRKIVHNKESLMVTVVGEIPLGSAERIALSMQAGKEHTDD